jgi:hypothetical protein
MDIRLNRRESLVFCPEKKGSTVHFPECTGIISLAVLPVVVISACRCSHSVDSSIAETLQEAQALNADESESPAVNAPGQLPASDHRTVRPR